MNNEKLQPENWSENVIIADVDYIDHVAFDFIVNFERIINRQIPPADMARWLDCIALDGGIRPNVQTKQTIQVILVRPKKKTKMENFIPADLEQDLNGKAFSDSIGEFLISSVHCNEMVNEEDFFIDIAQTICDHKDVKRVMLIPNAEEGNTYHRLRQMLKQIDDDSKRITMLTMQPMEGGNFRQEILGYSLMNALGIKADELNG
jgi:metal-dependent amidase/aminoacylase/carboxypeptidase family protein